MKVLLDENLSGPRLAAGARDAGDDELGKILRRCRRKTKNKV
jgi:hypothetical protein